MRRATGLSTLLLLATAAGASPLPLEVPVEALVGDTTALLALGPDGGVWVDLGDSESRGVEISARAAELLTLDQGSVLALCTPEERLALVSWPALEALTSVDLGCDALASNGDKLVAAGSEVVSFRVDGDALVEERREAAGEGVSLLAMGSGLTAYAVSGLPGVTEWSGVSTLAIDTRGPVAGLGMRDGLWVWSSPEDDVVRGQLGLELLTAGSPGRIWVRDLDGDGVDDVLVRHTDRVGIIKDDAEVLLPWRGEIAAVGVDARDCPSVWVATPSELHEFPGTCASLSPEPAAPVAVDAVPEAPEVPEVVVDGRTIAELRVRVGEPVVTKLVDVYDRRMTFAARGGPVGMVVYPDGALRYEARSGQEGTYMVSVRMHDGVTRRSAMLRVIVESVPNTPDGSSAREVPVGKEADASGGLDERLRPRTRGTVGRCLGEVGVGVAVSSVRLTWQFAGQSVVVSGSPALAVSCEGTGKWRWWLRGETAPMLRYVPVTGSDSVVGNPHGLGGALGIAYGNDHASVGPYLGGGIVYTGVGVRGVWMPLSMRGGRTHGLVADALLYVPSLPAGAVRVGWSVEL